MAAQATPGAFPPVAPQAAPGALPPPVAPQATPGALLPVVPPVTPGVNPVIPKEPAWVLPPLGPLARLGVRRGTTGPTRQEATLRRVAHETPGAHPLEEATRRGEALKADIGARTEPRRNGEANQGAVRIKPGERHRAAPPRMAPRRDGARRRLVEGNQEVTTLPGLARQLERHPMPLAPPTADGLPARPRLAFVPQACHSLGSINWHCLGQPRRPSRRGPRPR